MWKDAVTRSVHWCSCYVGENRDRANKLGLFTGYAYSSDGPSDGGLCVLGLVFTAKIAQKRLRSARVVATKIDKYLDGLEAQLEK